MSITIDTHLEMRPYVCIAYNVPGGYISMIATLVLYEEEIHVSGEGRTYQAATTDPQNSTQMSYDNPCESTSSNIFSEYDSDTPTKQIIFPYKV